MSEQKYQNLYCCSPNPRCNNNNYSRLDIDLFVCPSSTATFLDYRREQKPLLTYQQQWAWNALACPCPVSFLMGTTLCVLNPMRPIVQNGTMNNILPFFFFFNQINIILVSITWMVLSDWMISVFSMEPKSQPPPSSVEEQPSSAGGRQSSTGIWNWYRLFPESFCTNLQKKKENKTILFTIRVTLEKIKSYLYFNAFFTVSLS